MIGEDKDKKAVVLQRPKNLDTFKEIVRNLDVLYRASAEHKQILV
jgi:hypothetical protein